MRGRRRRKRRKGEERRGAERLKSENHSQRFGKRKTQHIKPHAHILHPHKLKTTT